MTLMDSYLVHRRRTNIRLWTGYLAANAVCISMLALVFYW